MNPSLPFRDRVRIYASQVNSYGTPSVGDLDDYDEIGGLLVQVLDYRHGNNQDAVVSATILHLPPYEAILKELDYRLEGRIIGVGIDGEEIDQFFKIESCNIARDVLLSNKIRHIECQLKKITAPRYVS